MLRLRTAVAAYVSLHFDVPRPRSLTSGDHLARIVDAVYASLRVAGSSSFRFEAAHDLPTFPDGHKCRRLHGHSFRVEVHVSGEPGAESGWIMDFADIKSAFDPILKQLDHYYLNEIDGLDNPTSENLARWIWTEMKPKLPLLTRVVIHE